MPPSSATSALPPTSAQNAATPLQIRRPRLQFTDAPPDPQPPLRTFAAVVSRSSYLLATLTHHTNRPLLQAHRNSILPSARHSRISSLLCWRHTGWQNRHRPLALSKAHGDYE